MKNWKQLKALPVYIAVAALVSACGASATSFQNSAGSSSNNSTGGNLVNPFPSPTPSTAAAPALQYEILNTGVTGATGTCKDCLTGQGGNYPVYSTYNASGGYINTDNLLQVKVTVQSGGQLSATGTAASGSSYSNFSTTYNCASFVVSVYDQNGNFYGSQSTGMLPVAGSQGCLDQANGPSQTLDFSGNIAQGPHGGLNVEVEALDYDFYCKLLANYWGSLSAAQIYAPEYYDLWCPYKTVYKTHSVSAQLEININGTTF